MVGLTSTASTTSLTFLYYVNRLCAKLNETPLTNINFASATGVYTEFQNAVNAAISDILLNEDDEWPFLWQTTSLNTTIGVNQYTAPVNALKLDWDAFYITRPYFTLVSLTQTAGIATATLNSINSGQVVTGDQIVIQFANNINYNGSFTVTQTSPTTFTFSVPKTTPSPDTSSFIQAVSNVSTLKLTPIDADAYRDEGYLTTDQESFQVGMYGTPVIIVRRKDNNILMSPKPDRVYTIPFDFYGYPAQMVNYNDTTIIPDIWCETIVNGAMFYAYKFRDNTEEATAQQKDFQDSVNRMRRILIPQQYFMRIDPSMGGASYNSSLSYWGY